MEDPAVFDATHELLAGLVTDGVVDGLRIDHPDGLADPQGYLDRLASATGGAWVAVEKILAPGEEVPDDWATAGTTGYDALWRVQQAFVDPGGAAELGALMHRLTGDAPDALPALIDEAKRQIVTGALYAEVDRLADLSAEICRGDVRLRDHTRRSLLDCLVELLVGADRYRYYVVPGEAPSLDARAAFDECVARARTRLEGDRLETLDLLTEMLLGQEVGSAGRTHERRRGELVVRFQQACGAVMAKGVEDTAFYRWTHLVALCEVGGAPERFAISPEELHAWAARAQHRSPVAMTALSTHDTKRSEDVRARLGVLSELPQEWAALVERVRAATLESRAVVVDGRIENLLWQTLAGTWTEDGPIASDRLDDYLTKAMRETKDHTGWTSVDGTYEGAVLDLAHAALVSPTVREVFEAWVRLAAPGVRAATLGTKLRPAHAARCRRRLPGHGGALDRPRGPGQPAARGRARPRRPPRPGVGSGSGSGRRTHRARGREAPRDVARAARTPGAPRGVRRRGCRVPRGPVLDRQRPRVHAHRRRRPRGGHRRDAPGPRAEPPRRLGRAHRGGPGGPVDGPIHGTLRRRRCRAPGRPSGDAAGRAPRPCGGGGVTGVGQPLRLWAPHAARVDLHTADVAPMLPADGGWWVSPDPVPHGTEYAFALDGGDPRPDPRSAWQPHGVHGPSRVFDAGRHRWADADWRGRDVRGAVIYELHVGTFTPTGTLDAAAERLDHLVDLGVDVVELMPVAAFPGDRGWGYDGVALYSVHEPYGGPAALQRFVDAAHARGLAVCLDVVHNHLGPAGNYLAEFGPYFTDAHHTPWGQAVNLDGAGSAEVRSFVVGNALRWLRDFHLDALRLDAVHALIDESPRHVLAELSDAVAALAELVDRPLALIAESDLNDARTVTPTARGGLGMTAQWADDVHHAVHALLTGERHGYYVDFGSAHTLATALTSVFVHDGGWSTFRGRAWGRPVPDDVDGHRFVVFASDHDQVGNRALGDRPAARLDLGGLAIEAALVLCSPFTPMLFMGEEWGASTPWQFFTDHEPELGTVVREGRRAEFSGHGWAELYGGQVEVPDPQAESTFATSRLDWSEPEAPGHGRLLAWYRDLVALRGREPDLASDDRSRTRVEHTDDVVVLHRGAVEVHLNLGTAPVTVALGHGTPEVLAAWAPVTAAEGRLELPGRSVAVVRTIPKE